MLPSGSGKTIGEIRSIFRWRTIFVLTATAVAQQGKKDLNEISLEDVEESTFASTKSEQNRKDSRCHLIRCSGSVAFGRAAEDPYARYQDQALASHSRERLVCRGLWKLHKHISTKTVDELVEYVMVARQWREAPRFARAQATTTSVATAGSSSIHIAALVSSKRTPGSRGVTSDLDHIEEAKPPGTSSKFDKNEAGRPFL